MSSQLSKRQFVVFALACTAYVGDFIGYGAWLFPAVRAEQPNPTAMETSKTTALRAYSALPSQTTAAEYDRFIATHPELLRAQEKPYGSALMWALEFGKTEPALALMRAQCEIPDGSLTLAARGGLDVAVPLLFGRGVTTHDRDFAVLEAAKYGHASTLQLLFSLRASPSVASPEDGLTPLHIAAYERKLAAIKVLLAHGAKLETRDREGLTPLSAAASAYRPLEKHVYEKLGRPHGIQFVDPGEAIGVKLLIEAGAQLHTTDNAGNTPLHHAVQHCARRAVEALLLAGAKVNVKNRAKQTPLALAKNSRCPQEHEKINSLFHVQNRR